MERCGSKEAHWDGISLPEFRRTESLPFPRLWPTNLSHRLSHILYLKKDELLVLWAQLKLATLFSDFDNMLNYLVAIISPMLQEYRQMTDTVHEQCQRSQKNALYHVREKGGWMGRVQHKAGSIRNSPCWILVNEMKPPHSLPSQSL